MNKILTMLIIAMISSLMASAQKSYEEEINVPLSSPGKAGRLDVSLHMGGVKISGYDGSEVKVKMVVKENDASAAKDKSGLRKINNNALDVEIEEFENTVEISGDHSKTTDFIIQVPRKFDLSINTHHNGDVYIENVSGTLEVNCHFGKMILHNISGSLIADTHHGEIEVVFTSIDAGKPMAFSTYHGDVDVTFPASSNFNAKIKSTKGEIYTDFDVDMKMQKVQDEVTEDGRRQIKIGGWMYGSIGSGGEEFMFNTYHGDVIIRKK